MWKELNLGRQFIMGKKYLFSTVGYTDPVSKGYDGPLIHVCRHYKPDVVKLFYSKDMISKQKEIEFCLRELEKSFDDNHTFEIQTIEDNALVGVHQYNTFFKTFQDMVKEIVNEMEEDDILYLNVSSGTPQMGGALLLMAYMKEGNIIPLQVSTPNSNPNVNGQDNRSVEKNWAEKWAENKDQSIATCKKRIIEVKCPDLLDLLKKQLLKNFIEQYDYAAALEIVNNMNEGSDDGEDLLNGAISRMQLDLEKAQEKLVVNGEEIIKIPSDEDPNSKKMYLLKEYILEMGIKLKQKKNVDFIRSISPVLKDLYWLLVEKELSIPLKKFINNKKLVRNKMENPDDEKLKEKGKKMLEALDMEYKRYIDTPVAASNLAAILESCYSIKIKGESDILYRIRFLRSVEREVRNLAAHEIVSMPNNKMEKVFNEKILKDAKLDEYIKPKEVTYEKVYDDIKYLAEVIIGTVDWGSYDDMNRRLIEQLKLS